MERSTAAKNRGWNCLLRSSEAATTVEHAILASIVVLAVFIGVFELGSWIDHRFALTARALRSEGSSDSTSRRVAGAPTNHPPRTSVLDLARFSELISRGGEKLVFGAGFLACAVLALLISRRSTRPNSNEANRDETSETLDKTVSEHQVFGKRQHLIEVLANDADFLLKGQVEVRHVMTPAVVAVKLQAPLGQIEQLMNERKLRHVIVEGPNGKLAGIISDRDVLRRAGRTAREIMHANPRTIPPDVSINIAMSLLLAGRFSCLPVFDGKRVCGILTTTDLLLTLQCTMQLLTRIAHLGQADPEFSDEMRRLDEVESVLARNRQKLDAFNELVQTMRLEFTQKPLENVVALAAELLNDSQQLTGSVSSSCQKIRARTHHVMSKMEMAIDPGTGLAKRSVFEKLLGNHCSMPSRYRLPCSVALLQIISGDEFVEVSTTDGEHHPLVNVAQALQRSSRDTDVLSRFDENTLAILMPHTGADGAIAARHRLFEIARLATEGHANLGIQCAMQQVREGETAEELLERLRAQLNDPASAELEPALAAAGEYTL